MLSSAVSRGAVAQLGERLNGIQEVDGSIPFSSTKNFLLEVVLTDPARIEPSTVGGSGGAVRPPLKNSPTDPSPERNEA